MKTQSTINSTASLARHALTASLALAALLLPGVAAAEADKFPSVTAAEADKSPGVVATEQNKSGWSLNFTPVLIAAHDDYRFGGGVDPELMYTLDRGGARLSAGLRVGGYYAKNLFGITTMPTVRLTVPVGPVEPYVSFGMGYGWLPKIEYSDIAMMSRLGVVFRFSERFALGLEGTIQKIDGSDFEFPSFGSAVAINF